MHLSLAGRVALAGSAALLLFLVKERAGRA